MIASGRPKRSKTARSRRATALPRPSPGSGAPHFVARLVPLDPGLYAFSLAEETGWREPVAGLAVPAVHLCATPHHGGVEITDRFGRAGSWLGCPHKGLFVKSPTAGSTPLVNR